MDHHSDDDIELLKQTADKENNGNSALGFCSIDAHISPLDLIKRGSSPGDSVDPASLHALNTAFGSIQRKLSEESRQRRELQHENKLLKKTLEEARSGQRQFHNKRMDDFAQDPNDVHAASGTSEDESIAETRAKDGLIHHLQREVIISNNTIKNCNEEIARLKQLTQDKDSELMEHRRNGEKAHSQIDALSKAMDKLKDENAGKDREITQMKNALQSEQQLNHNLQSSIDSLLKGQNEIQVLKSKIENYERERQKMISLNQELNRVLADSEKQVGALEAKCKQYEIEVNINRQHRSEKMEDSDDVDGEVAVLEKALDIIGTHRKEVNDLKQKLSEQQTIITHIQSTVWSGKRKLKSKRLPAKSLDSSLFRPEVQGSSFNPGYVEHHVEYANYSPNSRQLQDNPIGHSPLTRRISDRGDYRAMEVTRTSPRVNDNILPTGNQNITPMVAMETNPQLKRMEIGIDKKRSPVENNSDSRLGHSTSQGNFFSRTPGTMNQSNYNPQGLRSSSSPRLGNSESYTGGPAFVESPRTRENRGSSSNLESQGLPPVNRVDSVYIQTGARPRVPSSSVNISQHISQTQELSSPRQGRQQIPDRMTQSEIITRDRSTEGNALTRSVLEPLQPLEIPSGYRTQQNDYSQMELKGPVPHLRQQSLSEHIYENQQSRQRYNGPDYENIYNGNAQTEIKRPIEEQDDTVFVTAPERERGELHGPVQEETMEVNVSAVKICPVCSEEFSRLTLDQFQMHVFECFDNCDEAPATLKQTAEGSVDDDGRQCPMCGDVFPLTIPQETYEKHVLAHFGEDPLVERFELLQP